MYLDPPAMGDEILDDPIEEFFHSTESDLSRKKIAIFDSYVWGDSQWLRDWKDRIEAAGGICINGEGLMAQHTPGDADSGACWELGSSN